MLASLFAFLQVIIIDVVMSGDNAVAIALPIRNLSADLKKKALRWGIALAAIFRIILAFVGIYIMHYPLVKIGAAFLLVIMTAHLGHTIISHPHHDERLENAPTSLRIAISQIIVADISTSLENILAVTSAAYTHPTAMITGIILSVLLVGTIAAPLSRYLNKYPIISWIGVIIVMIVAIRLGYEGCLEVLAQTKIFSK